VVAYVAEQRTGKSWEELMQAEVFEPLGMATAGFGRPRSNDRPNEPTLHRKMETGFEPEPDDRNNLMAVFAPAGDAHCSIRDFAKFASYELNAALGNDMLLKPTTAKKRQEMLKSPLPLVYPPGKKLKVGAKGQGEKKGPPPGGGRGFFGGSEYVSSGCNLWPDQNLTVVAAINAGSCNDAIRGAHDVLKQVVTSS
jgi:CubicO group peptidase (beta-lactamase class C family)